MDFKEYQELVGRTAIYPNKGNNFVYPALGLGGETGELQEKIKKILRGDKTLEESKELIKKEAGDVLWYLTQLCTEVGLTLEEVVEENVFKLFGRRERGVLKGSGDTR